MKMRRMVRQRLLAAQAAVAVLISLFVLSADDLASNGGSLSAYMAPVVFVSKNSSYGSELHAVGCFQPPAAKHTSTTTDYHTHARDLCGDPGTAHEGNRSFLSSTSNLSSMLPAKRLRPSVTDLDQQLTNDDYIYIGYHTEGFACSFMMKKGIKEDTRGPGFVFPKSSPFVHDVCVDSILDIAEGYNESQTEDFAIDIYADLGFCPKMLCGAVGDMSITVDRSKNTPVHFTVKNNIGPLAPPEKPYQMIQGWSSFVGEDREGKAGFQEKTTELVPFLEESIWRRIHSLWRTEVFGPDAYGVPCSSLVAADNDSKPIIQWIFFKPLTKELWLATVCFIFFTGFVFWMIERSINPLFQGSTLAQFSTALYFVFSTLTFSHGQILRSPLSKTVLVVWCFAVLVLVQSYVATLSSMLAADASTFNGSSTAGPVPLTLGSFSGLFVVTGCILAFMLLISLTRSAYAAYTTVRASESQSTPQNDAANGSVVVLEQPVQEVRDNDSQGAHVSSAISPDEEAGAMQQDSNASEPAPDIYVQIEMTSTSNGVGEAL